MSSYPSNPSFGAEQTQAHVLSLIANCDWPDEYPELLDSLIGLLASPSPDSVHGAMQVFAEFIKADLSEDQILPVLRQLLPVLLNILGAPEVGTFVAPFEMMLTFLSNTPRLLVRERYQSSANVSRRYIWSRTNSLTLSRRRRTPSSQFGSTR